MSQEDVNTNAPEVKEEAEGTVETEQATQEEDTTEATVGDSIEEVADEPKQVDSIPKARLDKEINRRKELEKELAELKAEKEDEPEVKDVEKDPEVKQLADKLAKIEAREKEAKLNAAVESQIAAALENAPEFKNVANTEVLKQLALNPANKDKTYSQLLEETYGNSLGGKRTIETTTPRGGAKDTKVDLGRAQKDAEYRKEVLADPELRKQYNEGLENRIGL